MAMFPWTREKSNPDSNGPSWKIYDVHFTTDHLGSQVLTVLTHRCVGFLKTRNPSFSHTVYVLCSFWVFIVYRSATHEVSQCSARSCDASHQDDQHLIFLYIHGCIVFGTTQAVIISKHISSKDSHLPSRDMCCTYSKIQCINTVNWAITWESFPRCWSFLHKFIFIIC